MLSSLTTKLALRKVGIKSDTFDFSPAPKASKTNSDGQKSGFDDDEETSSNWPAWMTARKLPLTAQAWLSPVPPPVPLAECPKVGDLAPLDRDRQLTFGGGRKVVVLFMRCVGCACERLPLLFPPRYPHHSPILFCLRANVSYRYSRGPVS